MILNDSSPDPPLEGEGVGLSKIKTNPHTLAKVLPPLQGEGRGGSFADRQRFLDLNWYDYGHSKKCSV